VIAHLSNSDDTVVFQRICFVSEKMPTHGNPVMYRIIEEELPSLKVEYGNSCDIWHLHIQRFAGYCNFADFGTSYLMCIAVYLVTS
jgi:hypothetical protein